MIETHKITVTVAGLAGSAAGSAKSRSVVSGRVLAIHLDYTSQPATTDVTIATNGTNAPALTMLTRTNSGTDGWFYPRVLLDDTAGADLTAVYDAIPVDDHLAVTVAQGDPGSVDVYVLVER
jgi:hypothetical protein